MESSKQPGGMQKSESAREGGRETEREREREGRKEGREDQELNRTRPERGRRKETNTEVTAKTNFFSRLDRL